MAIYRNRSDQELLVAVGLRSARTVGPDETVEVDDDTAENYDLNENFVRVDGPVSPPPTVDAPTSEADPVS